MGAVLFSLGLLSVIMCGAQLYTGKSGYLPYKESWRLVPMLLGNAFGCMLMALLSGYVMTDAVVANLDAILTARLAASWHGLLITSVGTGMLMTLAVYGARRQHYLPLLLAVPVFILCGLPHCVADAYYYSMAIFQGEAEWGMLGAWGWAIIGNYVGCNLPRWFMGDKFEA